MKPYAELSQIAERVKRATRNQDILDLCDAVLERSPLVPVRTPPIIGDPQDRARRKVAQARVRMRRWRARRKAKDDAPRWQQEG